MYCVLRKPVGRIEDIISDQFGSLSMPGNWVVCSKYRLNAGFKSFPAELQVRPASQAGKVQVGLISYWHVGLIIIGSLGSQSKGASL